MMKIDELSPASQQALEAAAFRRLLEHLDSRKDVQNIDLMNLAGFCRNCLSKWYVAAAKTENIELDYEDARARIYGMPYAEWKEKYQGDTSAAQLQQFQQTSHRLCSFLSHVLRNLEDEIKMSQQHGGLIDEEEEVEVFRTSLALKAIKRALEE